MGWGGIVASALAGGISGGAQAGADDITMRQKEEMEKQREIRLSQLRMQEHATNTQVSSDIAVKQAGKMADEAALSSQRNSGVVNSVNAAKITSDEAAKAAAGAANADVVNATDAKKIFAEYKAKHDAELQSRTPEDQEKVTTALAEAKAKVDQTKSQTAENYAHARAYDADAAKKGREPAAKDEKFTPVWAKIGDNQFQEKTLGFIKTVEPGPFTFGAKDAKPGKPTKATYTTSDGIPISEAEVLSTIGTKASDRALAVAPPSSATPKGVPAGAREIGKDRKTGKPVYELNGERYIAD